MSNTIDTKVVEMKFDNAAFERGVANTLKSLGVLEKGLQLKGAANGLNEVNKAASHFNLGNIASGVQQISSRFTGLGIVGVTALASIAHQAIATGAAMLKSLTVQPLKDGLAEYETNLNSIQTILANTGLEGKSGLAQVTKSLDELNHYSDQTIYNFSEMARNIGTFTAAGIKLEPATAAIKGIANLAAVSGSNAEQASTAMYQLSQAMAAGKATLVDWNSVVNAGMGGKVFQEALKETARVQGVNIDAIIKKNGSFRDSLQEGWLTTKVLTETLSKFTGDLTADQLKSMGYNEKQIAGIIKMGKTAQDAATKVKTVSQLINTLQEAASSGWAKTWQLVFGDFDEAKTLFTNVSNVLGGFINKSSDTRNKVISDWKQLGGRKVLIDGIAIAFNNLMDILSPISKAFRDIFPATTGKQLFELTKRFTALMGAMRLNEGTMDNLRRTFRGVFAIISIGLSLLKGLGTILKTVFAAFFDGSGGILEFTGNLGDWLVALDQSIKKGEGFKQFFQDIGDAIAKPVKFLKNLIDFLSGASTEFAKFGAAGVSDFVKDFHPLAAIGAQISKVWSGVTGFLKSVFLVFTPLADKFKQFFADFGVTVGDGVAGVDWNSVLATINTGLFGALVLLFKKFLANGLKFDVGDGLFEGVKKSLEGLTGVLGAMQQNLRANALLKLAAAIGLLAVSVKLLSTVDPKQLAFATAAIATMFGQLLGAMKVLETVSTTLGTIKMPFIAASLILLGVAINLLAIAVKNLSSLSWQDMAKGLTGVAVLLGSLALFNKFNETGRGAVTSSAGLILLAVAIKLLVQSVKDLSGMDWGSMAKGLAGVAAILLSLGLFTKFASVNAAGIASGAGIVLVALAIKILASAISDIAQLSWQEIGKGMATMAVGLGLIAVALALVPTTGVLSAAAIVLVALSFTKIAYAVKIVVGALDSLADVVKKMGQMSWGEIAKGLTVMAVSIGLIGTALYLLPKTAIFSAAAVYIVAQALVVIAQAMNSMGGMSWGEIAKSLVTLAGSLAIIAGGLYLMTGALPGAAALIVVAAALRLLAPALLAFGDMSWASIAKGLVMLVGVFAVLGLAGLVLAPVVPVLIGLAGAVALLGLGMLAAGAGLALFSVGLGLIAVSGTAAAGALVASVNMILQAAPGWALLFAKSIIAFANSIVIATPAVTKAILVMLNAVLNIINQMSPKIVATFGRLLILLLQAAVRYIPQIQAAGVKIVLGLLNGIAKNVPKMVSAATDIIVAFITAIGAAQNRIIDAGVKMIISFINGVANTIRTQSAALGAAGANLASAIIEGMARGLAAGVGVIADKAKGVAQSALNAAKGVLGIHSPSKEFRKIGAFVVAGFVQGLDGNKAQINNAFYSLRAQLADFRREAGKDIADLTAKLAKLQDARKKDVKAINATKAALATARAEYAKTNNAYNVLTKNYLDDTVRLGKLADKYDVYSTKIKNAQQALADLIKTRDDYAKSVADQYSDLQTPADDQSLADFIAQGKKQVADTQVFAVILQKLRKLGLNDEAYKDLLAKGTSALPFVQELLASGKSGVAEVNKINSQLDALGSSLGKTAGGNLYNAGIQAAQGIVKGLQSQQKAIEKQMDAIAAIMLKAMKKALGIKSPSREMMEIARYTVEGMTVGLDKFGANVETSAKDVGDRAIATLRKTMSGISDVVTTDANFNPVIRPVLDLTGVQSDSTRIANLLRSTPLKVDSAFDKAKNAAAGYRNNQVAQQDVVGDRAADIQFTQINNSPKALSPATIYRQTKNQLSVAKGALTDAK